MSSPARNIERIATAHPGVLQCRQSRPSAVLAGECYRDALTKRAGLSPRSRARREDAKGQVSAGGRAESLLWVGTVVDVRPGRDEFSRAALSVGLTYAVGFVTDLLRHAGWSLPLMWVAFVVVSVVLTRRAVRRGATIRVGASVLAAFVVTVVVAVGFGVWAAWNIADETLLGAVIVSSDELWVILVGIRPLFLGGCFALGAYLAARLGSRRAASTLIP